MSYPVSFHVEHGARFTRFQLALRAIAFCALGILGVSFATAFAFAYLALPVFAAVRLGSLGAAGYLEQDGGRIVRALSWAAAICAWFGLVVDRLPTRDPAETVELAIVPDTHPTPTEAVWRLVTALPSAVALGFLGCIGSFVWMWAALSILVTERVGEHAFRYLTGLQRWSVRLLAYQASLVDEYPPFSFEDSEADRVTASRSRA